MLGTYYLVMCSYIPGEWILCLTFFWCGDGGLFFCACKLIFWYTVDLEGNCGPVSSSSRRFWHTLTPCCFCLSLGRHEFCDSLFHVQILHHIHCAHYKGDSHLISWLVDNDVSFSWTGSLLHATFQCVLLVGRYPKCSASLEGSYPSFELWKSMKCHISQGDTSQWFMLEFSSQQHMVPQVLLYLCLAVELCSNFSSIIVWSSWKRFECTSYLHEF